MGWSFARIPRMAAAVMRTAMYEVLYMPAIPNSAAINEAVEIAKNYEPAEVVSFINGILGSFVWDWIPATIPPPQPSLTGRMAATPAACWRCGPESWDCGRATPCSSM